MRDFAWGRKLVVGAVCLSCRGPAGTTELRQRQLEYRIEGAWARQNHALRVLHVSQHWVAPFMFGGSEQGFRWRSRNAEGDQLIADMDQGLVYGHRSVTHQESELHLLGRLTGAEAQQVLESQLLNLAREYGFPYKDDPYVLKDFSDPQYARSVEYSEEANRLTSKARIRLEVEFPPGTAFRSVRVNRAYLINEIEVPTRTQPLRVERPVFVSIGPVFHILGSEESSRAAKEAEATH